MTPHGWDMIGALSRFRSLAGIGTILATTGCGDTAKAPGAGPPAAGAREVRTASAPADACGWLSPADAAQIIGPLEGVPVPVRSLEHPDTDPAGAACRYTLATIPRVGTGAVLLHVDLTGGIVQERVGGGMAQQFREAIQAGTPSEAGRRAEPDLPSPGWDRVGKLWAAGYSTFTGRVGHVAVSALALTPEVAPAQTAGLAARVRDAIPDLPLAMPPDRELQALAAAAGEPLDEQPTGPDPCGLIPAAEAEQVLGKLVVPPYRSADNSPLAVGNGRSCAYFTAGHRALVIRPHWDSGKMMFRMARGVGGMAGGVMPDDTAAASDTLDGPWEEAAANGMTGQLYFLKGDRMLEVGYVTSSTDRAGAVRLARAAVEKL
ncbi:MAG: hypothetical protein ABI860_12670 [Gemmatimonadales bacterium]